MPTDWTGGNFITNQVAFQLMDSAIHLAVRNHFGEILSQFRNSPYSTTTSASQCRLSARDGEVRTDIVLVLAALPQLTSVLCPGCVGAHQETSFILPDYSQEEIQRALDVLLARGEVSFLQRIMIDGADIEDEDKDSVINSLQTTRDVFLCKTEDSSDIEEIGAESADTGGDDNHLFEDDGLSTSPPWTNEAIVSEENDRDTAGTQQFDIRKFCRQTKKIKSVEKKENVRGPDRCWVEAESFRSEQEFGRQPEAGILRELRENFTFSKSRRNVNNDQVQEYNCLYMRKKFYRKCPFKYRVLRFHNFPEVVIERIEGVEHDHERLEGYQSQFHWTKEMTDIICTNIRLGYSARKIGRILEMTNMFRDGAGPSPQQLNNKVSVLRKKFGLRSSSRLAYRSYEEYKEWRHELALEKLETPEEGIIEEVGGSSDNAGIVGSSETKTNVNVRAGVSPQVRARNNWYEVSSFQCEQDFCRSEIAEELKQFSCKEKQEKSHGAATVTAVKIYRFCCSFGRRKGNKPCKFTYRVLQFQTAPVVVVEAQIGVEHVHEKDPDYLADRIDTPFCWSEDMTSIVHDGLVRGLGTREIQKLLLNSGLFTKATFPTKIQLNNKINHVNRVFGLRQKLERFKQPNYSTGRTRGRPRMPKNRYVPFLEK